MRCIVGNKESDPTGSSISYTGSMKDFIAAEAGLVTGAQK